MFEEILLDCENDISTKHEKIFISNLSNVDSKEVMDGVDELENIVNLDNKEKIVNFLQTLVKKYKPNNHLYKQ